MSELVYKTAERNTLYSSTAISYTTITDMSIADSEFQTGKVYLILVTAQVGSNTTGAGWDLQLIHGSTAFSESQMHGFAANVANERSTYEFLTLWTAVSSEGLALQGKSSSVTAQLLVNFAKIQAYKLSDDLVDGTDYHFDESAGDVGLTTTPQTGATITFTPPNASEDWLVISYAQCRNTGNADGIISQLVRSGEGSSSTPASRMWNTGNHTQEIPHFLTRVFTLGNASNTFTETTVMEAGTTGTRLHSSIFALNLDKFAAHSFVYTDGSVNLSASAYATELATATLTAPATGTMIIGSSFQFDVGSYARTFKFRCQAYEDGGSQVDQPAGQTTASYLFHEGSQDSSSDIPEGLLTDLAVTDGLTYRVDVDASTSSTTSSPAAKHRSLWLFSTELSASAPEGVALGRGLIRILP